MALAMIYEGSTFSRKKLEKMQMVYAFCYHKNP